jgi:hypothetical protein
LPLSTEFTTMARSQFGLLLLTIAWICKVQGQSSCDEGWWPYSDAKCYKIFEEDKTRIFENYNQSAAFCKGMGGYLVAINSADEQLVFSQFLYEANNVVDDIWLGGVVQDALIQWEDGSDTDYTNWATGFPGNESDGLCVTASSTPAIQGQWTATDCTARRLVVCQKDQLWSIAKFQQIFREFRKQQLENPIVPLGFIYVQLGGQPDPEVLWPTLQWSQVTSEYAGHFFRAEGGGSGSFGSTQAEDSPRITEILNSACVYDESLCRRAVNHIIPKHGVSPNVVVSPYNEFSSDISWFLQFTFSDGEIRPQNQAVRIWKRVA